MANRSKKVVLSARVDPYLKAALELAAVSRKEKIVKLLETFVESGLYDLDITKPFLLQVDKKGKSEKLGDKISFMSLFTAIWTDDVILYKIRAGVLGPEFAGETVWQQAMVATGDHYFRGEDDLYGDMNGFSQKSGYSVVVKYGLNLELIRKEWPIIESYVSFIESNKPFDPGYDEYKSMLEKSLAK